LSCISISAIVEIDNLHSVILVRVRTYNFNGRAGDPASIREAMVAYVDKVTDFVNAADDP
jgi:hypothetical protein